MVELWLKNMSSADYVMVLSQMMQKSYASMKPKLVKFDAFLICLLELNNEPDQSDQIIKHRTKVKEVVHQVEAEGMNCIFPHDSMISQVCSLASLC